MSSQIVEVCLIESIEKHPNADKLSLAKVKGWQTIVGLNQYNVGDKIIFVPPDYVIPNEIVEKYNLEYLKKNNRTGVIKLRGYVSEGLILDVLDDSFCVGDDVSKQMGIKKYQVPESPKMRGVAQVSKKKLNPLFDKYTDIENIKHYNEIFNDGDTVVITEKIHGSNWRASKLEILVGSNQPFYYKILSWIKKSVFRQTKEFVYGSHNVQISGNTNRKSFYGTDIWGAVCKKYDIANIIPDDYILYGEIYGKGIQDLTYGIDDVQLLIFDIKYRGKYLDWDAVEDFCNENGLRTVPVLYVGKYTPDLIEKFTTGKSVICPTQIREGIVVKCNPEQNHPQIGRKILKSVSPDYLLRKDATEYK